jgi:hypothetical protein
VRVVRFVARFGLKSLNNLCGLNLVLSGRAGAPLLRLAREALVVFALQRGRGVVGLRRRWPLVSAFTRERLANLPTTRQLLCHERAGWPGPAPLASTSSSVCRTSPRTLGPSLPGPSPLTHAPPAAKPRRERKDSDRFAVGSAEACVRPEAEAEAAPPPGGRTDLEDLLALCVAVRAEVGRAEAGEVGGHLVDAVGDLGF